MNGNKFKKLVLNRETVRTLQDRELSLVAGGVFAPAEQLAKAGVQIPAITLNNCPCGSSITDGVSYNQYQHPWGG